MTGTLSYTVKQFILYSLFFLTIGSVMGALLITIIGIDDEPCYEPTIIDTCDCVKLNFPDGSHLFRDGMIYGSYNGDEYLSVPYDSTIQVCEDTDDRSGECINETFRIKTRSCYE